MSENCFFAIDFTHEGMTAAFVLPDGSDIGAAGLDLADFRVGETDPIDKLAAMLMAKARTAPGPIRAVIASLPCDMDRERTRIVNFPQASWLSGQPLPEILTRVTGSPALMERRAVIRLACDQEFLELPSNDLSVGCYIETHYETAIWHRGGPVTGRNGMAGNVMHMTIHDREDACFCGKHGCVDLYGAGARLRQMHSMIFPDTPMDEIFVHHGTHPLILDYLSMMAYPIAMEANILDPDHIIIGGAVPSMRGFPRKVLEDDISRLSYRPDPDATPLLLASAVSGMPGTVCAAMYAMKKMGLR